MFLLYGGMKTRFLITIVEYHTALGSWGLKINKFISAVSKCERMGAKLMLRIVNEFLDKITPHTDLTKGKSLGTPARIEEAFLFKTHRHYQGCVEADAEAAMSVFGPQMGN